MATKSSSTIIVCIYRPPGPVTSLFCDELSDMFNNLHNHGKKFIVCGDFNCPPGAGSSIPVDERLVDLISCYNLTQHVNQPTHSGGNILDLIITSDNDDGMITDV